MIAFIFADNSQAVVGNWMLDMVQHDVEQYGEHSCSKRRFQLLLSMGLDMTLYEYVVSEHGDIGKIVAKGVVG